MDESTLQKALKVGRFGEDGMMPVGELIIVLLAMSKSSHFDTISSMFPVSNSYHTAFSIHCWLSIMKMA